MRVLLTSDTVGGVWTFTRELTEALLEDGHSVALISFGRSPSREQSEWAASTQTAHPDLFHFTPSDLPLEWMQRNENVFAEGDHLLTSIATRFRPDILHSNQLCFGTSHLPCPRLITAHSDVLSWAEACRRHGLEPSPWLVRYTDLVQRGLVAAGAVVAPTHAMLTALGRNLPLPARQRVISNGRSLPPASTLPERHLQAITAGRLWDEAKNIRILAEITSPLPILVAGEQHFEDTTSVTAPSLRFTGPLPEPALLDLFRASAIYIAPALYEPFGLAPLEAALCGCAILANDLPSLREVWGDAALYFTDPASLERQLLALANNPAHLAAAQQRAYTRATTFSREAMTANYLTLYSELIDERHARTAPHEEQQHVA